MSRYVQVNAVKKSAKDNVCIEVEPMKYVLTRLKTVLQCILQCHLLAQLPVRDLWAKNILLIGSNLQAFVSFFFYFRSKARLV